MSDINNLTEITENFDTIKTLLNSIRAQGILNTSDVDKLLAGINSKLEKINTEEDIDLIKIFLSELKQNLEERHSVLLSKFGAIESLFSNLLKNSSEALKSSEVKELFDIVATNLSVFSREVVSQKETLSDIILRLDSMRSDDSQKKEIIKNITILKNDTERLNNGFDSIVLSLNENFKSVIKTISGIDQTEGFDKFSSELKDITDSSNTILSALQMLDKKNETINETLKTLATQDDLLSAKKWISDLAAQEHELSQSVENLSDKYYKIDNLAEKIDASVDIIAGLKTIIADNDERNTNLIIKQLNELGESVKELSSDEAFDEFKKSLEEVLNSIFANSSNIKTGLDDTYKEFVKINDKINALDINTNFKSLVSDLNKTEQNVREHISLENNKLIQLVDVNTTRTLNEITSNADNLSVKLASTQNLISTLCEKSFDEIEKNISDLKTVVNQIDENNLASNNAIFSNITDRLAMFENSLKESLDAQESCISKSSLNLIEQVNNIKDLSGVLDYKLDSSVIEISNAKKEFSDLKTSVDDVLALDFTNKVKDLKVDLFSVKQDLQEALGSITGDVSDKIIGEIFSKYELLVSKLVSVENEMMKAQASSLESLKSNLDNISSSLVDIISYVSLPRDINIKSLDAKLDEISKTVRDNDLNYVENVRDIVDVIRTQVVENISKITDGMLSEVEQIKSEISASGESVKKDIHLTCGKLLEVQKSIIDNNVVLSDAIRNDVNVTCEKLSEVQKSIIDNNIVLSDAIRNDVNVTCEKLSEVQKSIIDNNIVLSDAIKNDIQTAYTKLLDLQDFLSKNANSVGDDIKNEIKNACNSINQFQKLFIEANQSTDSLIKEDINNIMENISEIKTSLIENASNNSINIRQDIRVAYEKLIELENSIGNNSSVINNDISSVLNTAQQLKDDFEQKISTLKTTLFERVSEFEKEISCGNAEKISELKFSAESLLNKGLKNSTENKEELIGEINKLSGSLSLNIQELSELLSAASLKIETANNGVINCLKNDFSNSLSNSLSEVEVRIEDFAGNIDSRIDNVVADFGELKESVNSLSTSMASVSTSTFDKTAERIDTLSANVESLSVTVRDSLASTLAKTLDNFVSLKALLTNIQDKQSQDLKQNIDLITSDFEKLCGQINILDSNIDEDLSRQLSLLENGFNEINNSVESLLEKNVSELGAKLDAGLEDIRENVGSTISEALENYKQQINKILEQVSSKNDEQAANVNSAITELNQILKTSVDEQNALYSERLKDITESLRNILEENIKLSNADYGSLKQSLETFKAEAAKNDLALVDGIKSQIDDISKYINEGISIQGIEINAKLNEGIERLAEELEGLSTSLLASNADISAGELQSMEIFANKIIEQVNSSKKSIENAKNLINNFVKEELATIAEEIEKETDVIVKDLLEQMSLLKDFQKDELSKLTIHIESSVEDYIYDHINDLKSYLDVKTDSSIINNKIDNINASLSRSVEDILSASNKLLEASVFDNAMNDIKAANEILISSMTDSLNTQIQDFIISNVSRNIDDKFTLFDKKFTDTIVDNFEEVKLISSRYNDAFASVEVSVKEILNNFISSKNEINDTIESLLNGVNNGIEKLNLSFADLKAQILNKSFDEAFQASINNQISGIEKLIKEQFGYLEDISDLCCTNLPELSEMNTLVKHGIIASIDDLTSKLEDNDASVQQGLCDLKTDIITQFINLFNQISFVTEQEEIIDFIQEKHSELITILSHIVNNFEDFDDVKDTVKLVDIKVDSLKEDIEAINEKISSIMSSDGDVDYVYSLHDLESDIANLRLSLDEIKDAKDSSELEELIQSTNSIYTLVESIKEGLPEFKYDEFKKDFETLNEDIVSISTRTNKLILASDESYKTLQDNLQDFKLVINDLDERTRNFAQDCGLDKIDNKLCAINTLIQNGAKTNQVFNQVFEYLAEWVDNAGAQIASISDKVETLDEIGQIKVMLEDLKAEAEDDSSSTELIEALSSIFEKQAKKISSLEVKLDRMIVETTINNKNNKIDMAPMEDTLNRFLVAIDSKMASQQDKIHILESKLEEAVSMLDPKDTAQLTKKVGGMDRQIAKLNKSIEKIASHVVEK